MTDTLDLVLRAEAAEREADELRAILSQVRRSVVEARAEFALIPDGIAEPILDTVGHRLDAIHEAVMSTHYVTAIVASNEEIVRRINGDIRDAEQSGEWEEVFASILLVVGGFIERNRHPETRAFRTLVRWASQSYQEQQRARLEAR